MPQTTTDQQTEATARPAYVYRLFDAVGDLLYIGSSYNPQERCKAHHWREWWPQVAHRTEEQRDDRDAAYQAETSAIWREKPRYNVAGTEANAKAAVFRSRAAYLRKTGAQDAMPDFPFSLSALLARLPTEADLLQDSCRAAYDVAFADPDGMPVAAVQRAELVAFELLTRVRGLEWWGRRRLIWEGRREAALALRAEGLSHEESARVMGVVNARILAVPHLVDDDVL